MSLIVQKYGGSSVADADSIKRVARRVVETMEAGNRVAVVVSAMGDTTDELIDRASGIDPDPPARELDMLMTAGERISMSLLAMAIHSLGHRASSFTGQQAGFLTDARYGAAHIRAVRPGRVSRALDEGRAAIVAGFQGINSRGDTTTLGRGGVEYARRFGMPLHVRSSFSHDPGTLVAGSIPGRYSPGTGPGPGAFIAGSTLEYGTQEDKMVKGKQADTGKYRYTDKYR